VALASVPSESGPDGTSRDHVSDRTVYSRSWVQPARHAGPAGRRPGIDHTSVGISIESRRCRQPRSIVSGDRNSDACSRFDRARHCCQPRDRSTICRRAAQARGAARLCRHAIRGSRADRRTRSRAIVHDMDTNFFGTLNVVRTFLPILEPKGQAASVGIDRSC
jgi:hypothetical protein